MDAIGGATPLGEVTTPRFIAPARLDQVAQDLEQAQALSGPQFAQLTTFLNVTVMNIDSCRYPQMNPAMMMLFGGGFDPMAMQQMGQMMQQQQMSMMMAMMMYQQMQLMMMLMMMMMSQQNAIPPGMWQQMLTGTQPSEPPRQPSEMYQDKYNEEIKKAQAAAANIDPKRIAELTKIEEAMYKKIVGDGKDGKDAIEALAPGGKIENAKDAEAALKAFEGKLQPELAAAQKRGDLKTIHERNHAEHTLRARFCAALADHLRKVEKDKEKKPDDKKDGSDANRYHREYEKEIKKAQEAGKNVDPERIGALTALEQKIYHQIVGEKGVAGLAPNGKIESAKDAEAARGAFEEKLQARLAAAQQSGDLKTVHERDHAEHSIRAQFLIDLSDHFREADKHKKSDESKKS